MGEKPKNHRYRRWKNFPTWTKDKEGKDWWREKGFIWEGTWIIKDLVRISCCLVFSGVELQRTNCKCRLPDASFARKTDLRRPELNYNGQTTKVGSSTLPAPGRQIFGYLPTSGPFRKLNWLEFLLVTSSLSSHLARLLARLDALFSASCWSSLFPLKRLGGSSHRWCNINCRKSCHRLVRVILVERVDKFSKVLDRWVWLPGILFLWIPFPRRQVVKTW